MIIGVVHSLIQGLLGFVFLFPQISWDIDFFFFLRLADRLYSSYTREELHHTLLEWFYTTAGVFWPLSFYLIFWLVFLTFIFWETTVADQWGDRSLCLDRKLCGVPPLLNQCHLCCSGLFEQSLSRLYRSIFALDSTSQPSAPKLTSPSSPLSQHLPPFTDEAVPTFLGFFSAKTIAAIRAPDTYVYVAPFNRLTPFLSLSRCRGGNSPISLILSGWSYNLTVGVCGLETDLCYHQ